MKKILYLCLMTILIVTGCSINKEYYCDEGDTLIKDTCVHKTTKQALVCGCPRFSGCNLCPQFMCFENANSLCPNKTITYRCYEGDGELMGNTCVKETTYPAHTK